MIYTGPAITELVKEGRMIISPFNHEQVQSASYDLRLSNKFMCTDLKYSTNPDSWYLDLGDAGHNLGTYEFEDDHVIISSKGVVLAQSLEYVKLPPDVAAKVMDKSSLGRLFLNTTGGNAGWVDPGFEGHIVLEIVNNNNFPIKLVEGMRICQLIFYHTIGLPSPYKGSYQEQRTFSEDRWKRSLKRIATEFQSVESA